MKAALEAGVPAYTGDIKEDWFRETLAELKPACRNLLRLRPTDRPAVPDESRNSGFTTCTRPISANGHRRGTGALGQHCRDRDAETTCWTVHHMNEQIDDGHIVGVSPDINIRLADGGFPGKPIDFYSKMSDGLDHLVFHTARSLVGWHQRGQTTPLNRIDFNALIAPGHIKQRMLEPIRDFPQYTFPDPNLFAASQS